MPNKKASRNADSTGKASAMLALGARPSAASGWLCLAAHAAHGVDALADVETRLPLANDSLETVHIDQETLTIRNPLDLLAEIQRVCRHGAHVCLTARYTSPARALADPRHMPAFNEHAARYWTPHPWRPHETTFDFVGNAPWGLLAKLPDPPALDMRCARMEFLPFEEATALPAVNSRQLCLEHPEAVDRIVYCLVVIKQPTDAIGMNALLASRPPQPPPATQLRLLAEQRAQLARQLESVHAERDRLREAVDRRDQRLAARDAALQEQQRALDRRRTENDGLVARLEAREHQLSHLHEALEQKRTTAEQWETRCNDLRAEMEKIRKQTEQREAQLAHDEEAIARHKEQEAHLEAQLFDCRTAMERVQANEASLASLLEQAHRELERLPAMEADLLAARDHGARLLLSHDDLARQHKQTLDTLKLIQGQLQDAQAGMAALEAREAKSQQGLIRTEAALTTLKRRLATMEYRAVSLLAEWNTVRARPVVRLLERLHMLVRGGEDLRDGFPPHARELIEASLLWHELDVRAYRVARGPYLAPDQPLQYTLRNLAPGCAGFLLLPGCDALPYCRACITLSLLGPNGALLREAKIQARAMTPDSPGMIRFPVILEALEGPLTLCLRGEAGVRDAGWFTYEWRPRRGAQDQPLLLGRPLF